MKVPRLSLAKLHGFSHYGNDCPLRVLWRALYKSSSYEEFAMRSLLSQEPEAPIDLGTVQAFIYEYSCGGASNKTARRKLSEYRDILCVERFRRGDVGAFEIIKSLLEPEEIADGQRKYDEWWDSIKTGNLPEKRGIEVYHCD